MSQSLWPVAYYKLTRRRPSVFFTSLYQTRPNVIYPYASEKVAGRDGLGGAVSPGGGMEIGGGVGGGGCTAAVRS